MYVVLVTHKIQEALSDAIQELNKEFPNEIFSIEKIPNLHADEKKEDKGYKLRIEGVSDEKLPRKFAEKFLKKWVPKPKEEEK